MSVRLHWHIPLLTALADDVDCPARPVDTALRIDATDLVKPASGPERESDEALEAQMERLQQERLLVERQNARPRLVLSALDAAERIADVVALVDRALEDGLEQPALATELCSPRRGGDSCGPDCRSSASAAGSVANDVGFRDLVEPLRTEVRHEVRADLSVTVSR